MRERSTHRDRAPSPHQQSSDDSDDKPTDPSTGIGAQLKETLQQKSHIAGHYGSHQPQTSGSIRVNKNSQLAVTEVNPDFFWDE